MEKIIYHGHDITEAIERKEKKIIELYSRQRKIPFDTAEVIYSFSNLKKALRIVDNDLWTQSEYYIIEAYSDVLDEVDIDTILNNKKQININVNAKPATLLPWQRILEEEVFRENMTKMRETINAQNRWVKLRNYIGLFNEEDILEMFNSYAMEETIKNESVYKNHLTHYKKMVDAKPLNIETMQVIREKRKSNTKEENVSPKLQR